MTNMNTILQAPQLLDKELTTDEIHIWCASLDQPVSGFQRLLSVDEEARAERYHFDEDRRRFIVRRGILKTLLGNYLGIEPYQIQFCYGKNGKPALSDTFGNGEVRFNLSHSEGLALYAFTRSRKIGVDIEYIRDVPEMEQIADRYFSENEKAVFHTLPESKKKEAFFNCWTRKEAFIKATGEGLSASLDRFDVSLAPGEPARLLGVEGDSIDESQWSICNLNIDIRYKAALVKEGKCCGTIYFQWQL